MYSTEHMRQYSEMKSKTLEKLDNISLISILQEYPEPTFWEVGPDDVKAFWKSADEYTSDVLVSFTKNNTLLIPILSCLHYSYVPAKKIYPAHPWFYAVRDACANKGLWFEKEEERITDVNENLFHRILRIVRTWIYMFKYRWVKSLPYQDLPDHWK